MVSEDVEEAHSRRLALPHGNSVDQAVDLSKGQTRHGVQPNEDVPNHFCNSIPTNRSTGSGTCSSSYRNIISKAGRQGTERHGAGCVQ